MIEALPFPIGHVILVVVGVVGTVVAVAGTSIGLCLNDVIQFWPPLKGPTLSTFCLLYQLKLFGPLGPTFNKAPQALPPPLA